MSAFLGWAYSSQFCFNLLQSNSGKESVNLAEQSRKACALHVSPQIYHSPSVMLFTLDARNQPLPRQHLKGHNAPG